MPMAKNFVISVVNTVRLQAGRRWLVRRGRHQVRSLVKRLHRVGSHQVDVDEFDEIKLCTGYRINGEVVTGCPIRRTYLMLNPSMRPGRVGRPRLVLRAVGMICPRRLVSICRIAELVLPIRCVRGTERAVVVLDTYGVEGLE